MILVLIFIGIIALVAILAFILILSVIRIKIEDLKIGNISGNISKLKGTFQIYFLNKIKILSIKFNSKKLKKIYDNPKLKKIDWKNMKDKIPINIENIKILKKAIPKIAKLDLKINVGTEDAILTSYLVVFIASMIGIIFPHIITKQKDIEKCKYIITPVYKNKNLYQIELNGILEIKIVHIIYVIFNFIKKGSKKNERTSDRRTYGYSHEFN